MGDAGPAFLVSVERSTLGRRCAAPPAATENEAGRKFCGECGSPLAAACPSCGAPNSPGVKFCGECGSALVDARPPPVARAPAPAAERKLVSVLFADLVGFTSLSESRDARTPATCSRATSTSAGA